MQGRWLPSSALSRCWLSHATKAPSPPACQNRLSRGRRPRAPLRHDPPLSCGACPDRSVRRYAVLRGVPARLPRRAGRRVQRCERGVAAGGGAGECADGVTARKGLLFFLSVLGRFPHQLNGGQHQRVMVARTLLLRPRLIAADEPVSMVDASLCATILSTLHTMHLERSISISQGKRKGFNSNASPLSKRRGK